MLMYIHVACAIFDLNFVKCSCFLPARFKQAIFLFKRKLVSGRKMIRGKSGGNLKICFKILILDVVDLQTKSKKKSLKGRLPF